MPPRIGAVCDRRVRIVDGSPRERILHFSRLAAEGAEEWDVIQAERRITRGIEGARGRAGALLAFVQSLPYWPDPPGIKDYISRPCQVLTIGGDCEDLATLLVSLWVASDLGGRLVWMPQGGDQDHVAPQVLLPVRGWTWAEPTVEGARLGEAPRRAAARLGAARTRDGGL